MPLKYIRADSLNEEHIVPPQRFITAMIVPGGPGMGVNLPEEVVVWYYIESLISVMVLMWYFSEVHLIGKHGSAD